MALDGMHSYQPCRCLPFTPYLCDTPPPPHHHHHYWGPRLGQPVRMVEIWGGGLGFLNLIGRWSEWTKQQLQSHHRTAGTDPVLRRHLGQQQSLTNVTGYPVCNEQL
jgi:hypothetical protein